MIVLLYMENNPFITLTPIYFLSAEIRKQPLHVAYIIICIKSWMNQRKKVLSPTLTWHQSRIMNQKTWRIPSPLHVCRVWWSYRGRTVRGIPAPHRHPWSAPNLGAFSDACAWGGCFSPPQVFFCLDLCNGVNCFHIACSNLSRAF